MKFDVWCLTDVGLKREINQDSVLIDRELQLFVVADGMGGHKGGEVASKMAVEKVKEVVAYRKKELSARYTPNQLLQEAYTHASHSIYDQSLADVDCSGMGTTLVTAMIWNDQVYFGNVGDSRAYLFSHKELWQITEDHSALNQRLREGLLSEENIPYFTDKNVITRSVGYERDVDCDVFQRQAVVGESYLLCSDGLSGMVEDSEIKNAFLHQPVSTLTTYFIEAAKRGGGTDNITALVFTLRG